MTGIEVTETWWWWTHVAASWAMVGLIWVVQRVIYPLMARQPEAGFADWHQDYTRRLGPVVGPLMAVELVGGLGWVWVSSGDGWAWVALAFTGVNWLSTAALQMPIHRRLAQGYDSDLIARLVATNWLRTVSWTARGGLLIYCAMA
jgi:hypothetical protein